MPVGQGNPQYPVDVAANLGTVLARISAAATAAGRDPNAISLVAVSKTHDARRIIPALETGHRLFGENRVQEAEDKWPALKSAYPEAQLHLIGPLQSNKVKRAVELFDVIETVDRPKLARAIARHNAELGRQVAIFVQLNTGEESQKAGVAPADLDDFVKFCRDDCNLEVRGLMCIPPIDDEPALHFAFLRELALRNGLSGLSMGMSGDFDKAIAHGASHVRIGTAIFGPRAPWPAV